MCVCVCVTSSKKSLDFSEGLLVEASLLPCGCCLSSFPLFSKATNDNASILTIRNPTAVMLLEGKYTGRNHWLCAGHS